jgi:glycosyltransferase involved in cell wall biosynthesis
MKKPKLKISVVTPSYNQGKFIDSAIRSIISQDYSNLQYVICDGASNDETLQVLNTYRTHERIENIVSEKDKGQVDALIKGFQSVNGDILCWVNSDDMLAPHALNTVNTLFTSNPDIDVVVGNLMVIDADGKELGMWPRKMMQNKDWFSLPQAIGQPATFFSRKAYDAVGGINPEYHYSMDYDLFMKMGLRGFKFHYTDDILAYFRVHQDSKSMALPHKLWKEEFRIYFSHGGRLLSGFTYWKLRGIISILIKSKIFHNRKW